MYYCLIIRYNSGMIQCIPLNTKITDTSGSKYQHFSATPLNSSTVSIIWLHIGLEKIWFKKLLFDLFIKCQLVIIICAEKMWLPHPEGVQGLVGWGLENMGWWAAGVGKNFKAPSNTNHSIILWLFRIHLQVLRLVVNGRAMSLNKIAFAVYTLCIISGFPMLCTKW